MYNDVRKALHMSLPSPLQIRAVFEKDEKIIKAWRLGLIAIRNHPKYKKNPLLYKLKTDALKNELFDNFIKGWYVKIQIHMNIRNKLILDYFEEQKKRKPKGCQLGCRNIGWGFCFC